MKIGYVRVSSQDQNEARQIEALQQQGVEKFFSEKISGQNMNRPTASSAIKKLGLSRSTFYRKVKEYEQSIN
ncbi:recombinase family protein [Paenibacillus sediminis]|uniref:DNA invertase Pin-like site-specific DNA recombinase n=1 Tax=Paenibacillus sediminis TaxID=664909 RepID=A0ABS4H8Z1_9BACL|nr:recombinase family protein [Paenibacillus sediminis]MBP1938515.1 DNA invertase Pin-like site-specific DNA recombinase [Paenibacillus sediminis]